jgi:hypothetical protein
VGRHDAPRHLEKALRQRQPSHAPEQQKQIMNIKVNKSQEQSSVFVDMLTNTPIMN